VNKLAIAGALLTILGACSNQVSDLEQSEGYIGSRVSAAVNYGHMVQTDCSKLKSTAQANYPQCSGPVDATAMQVAVFAKCEDISEDELKHYSECVISKAPRQYTQPAKALPAAEPEIEPVAKDFEASASSSYLGNVATGKSYSEITSEAGVRTATQESGSVSISISSGMDITQTSIWQGAVSE
jgi:hypothetical protein